MAASNASIADESATSSGDDDGVGDHSDACTMKDYFRAKIMSFAKVALTEDSDPRDASSDPMEWSEEKKAKVRAAIRADIALKQTHARREGKMHVLELSRGVRKTTFGQLMEKHQLKMEEVRTDSQLMPPPPPETKTVRKSARKKAAPPAATGTPQVLTPQLAKHVITPKFDPTTPRGRHVMRLALPNETLVSLAGSPVHPGPVSNSRKVTRAQKMHPTPYVPVPAGEGKTLMVPLKEDDGGAQQHALDLSEEARTNLERLRANLDHLLLANAQK